MNDDRQAEGRPGADTDDRSTLPPVETDEAGRGRGRSPGPRGNPEVDEEALRHRQEERAREPEDR